MGIEFIQVFEKYIENQVCSKEKSFQVSSFQVLSFSKLFQLIIQLLNSFNWILISQTPWASIYIYSIESCKEESVRDLMVTESFVNLTSIVLPLV